MRLLVTRPQPEADDLAARLRVLGHDVLVQPLLRIVLAPQPPDLPMPAALAFTSRNAVRAVSAWPLAATWRPVRTYAVGGATAAAARSARFTNVRSADGDSGALAAFIRDDFPRETGLLLHPAAQEAAADLGLLLPDHAVATVAAYHSEPAAALAPAIAAALAAGKVDGVLLYSRRTAATFADLAQRSSIARGLASTTLYALSVQVAEPLTALAPARIAVAPQPAEEALLSLLEAPLARRV